MKHSSRISFFAALAFSFLALSSCSSQQNAVSPRRAPAQVKVLKINTNIRGGLGSAYCRWDSSDELRRLQNTGWIVSGETPLQYTTQTFGGQMVFCEGKSVTLSK